MYHIETVAGPPLAGSVSAFEIAHYSRFEGASACAPSAFGQLVFQPQAGFWLCLWCFEENPRTLYHNPNDPVHTDSCLEAFLQFYPGEGEPGYLSIEMNAGGASHCSFGTGRHTRGFLVERGLPHPEVEADRPLLGGRPAWRVQTLLRLAVLNELYGRCDFAPGHRMKGNFYKCGDHTDRPHWGSWHPIGRKDFHTPEFFGDLVMD